MDIVSGSVNHYAAFVSSKLSFWVQPEIPAFYRIAKGFIVNAPICGVQRKPIVPTRKEISERTEQAAGLAVKNVIGAGRDRPTPTVQAMARLFAAVPRPEKAGSARAPTLNMLSASSLSLNVQRKIASRL